MPSLPVRRIGAYAIDDDQEMRKTKDLIDGMGRKVSGFWFLIDSHSLHVICLFLIFIQFSFKSQTKNDINF